MVVGGVVGVFILGSIFFLVVGGCQATRGQYISAEWRCHSALVYRCSVGAVKGVFDAAVDKTLGWLGSLTFPFFGWNIETQHHQIFSVFMEGIPPRKQNALVVNLLIIYLFWHFREGWKGSQISVDFYWRFLWRYCCNIVGREQFLRRTKASKLDKQMWSKRGKSHF